MSCEKFPETNLREPTRRTLLLVLTVAIISFPALAKAGGGNKSCERAIDSYQTFFLKNLMGSHRIHCSFEDSFTDFRAAIKACDDSCGGENYSPTGEQNPLAANLNSARGRLSSLGNYLLKEEARWRAAEFLNRAVRAYVREVEFSLLSFVQDWRAEKEQEKQRKKKASSDSSESRFSAAQKAVSE